MKKKTKTEYEDDLRPEYDLKTLLKGADRGKDARQYRSGTNLVLLDTDVAKTFRSSQAVNAALRMVIQLKKIPNGSRSKRHTTG